ncbi:MULTISPECIES: hypothetical protein [unclassified Arthrobacter]|uniref:hypothetical protein n=1 Tax=unclassified Arthrobacter TaxID=235627 RepID=UPI00210550E0|nr:MULTISPECIES: hypothetical protein [unclassified Arthrobacter]MCQ1948238.1 hypothetical protein [Arthrobacter sp. zg-Y1116]MCQ1996616.1 hypothetical protein [Arthrobacter sp. zg-Y1171]UWX82215.1 hypothetical protein N2L00_01880 [Arthrobacter sp. zg-Y1171]
MRLGSRVRCLTDRLRRGDGRRAGTVEEPDGHTVHFGNTVGDGVSDNACCNTVSDAGAHGNARS